MSDMVPLEERYKASMVLSGAGDALGYNHGNWEFEKDGAFIHEEVQKRGGLEKLDAIDFPVSDDTVMHLATAEALVKLGFGEGASLPVLYQAMVEKYIVSMTDMVGRGAGITCINSVAMHRQRTDQGIKIPFNKRGGGCGAAMRAMCIGLRFPDPEQEHLLIAVSVESGRLTHHHPTGYLGALAAALFTAYAVRGTLPVEDWGHRLMDVLDKAKEYVRHSGNYVEQNMDHWDYFGIQWRAYLEKRGILDGKSKPQFPECYGVKEREHFYRAVSFKGVGGASGHDAPMIAYDALLRAGDSWVELANHGFFHGGDSDSTAVIAAAWWGALFGFRGVPEINYRSLEYRDRLSKLGQQLYELRGKPLDSEKEKSKLNKQMVKCEIHYISYR
ncbi:protein ADP-ribosylarginine hydrolase [Coregonus clupeaformis]|uniref:protein ADP-ribosylarginine hydrolase n=1 Tax=Coregonus clupeaformis TaxID=59861 RepID=UPI001BDF8605|nr:protein ADP-ribosylarginine hydrolase [Coregonus clupeaformis]XP_041700104.1 protein ADP-ribosylarginine hydrolase [Coregonus clupeaformis]